MPKQSATQDQPLFKRIRDVFQNGFRIDWTTTLFLGITHAIVLIATPFAYVYAPGDLWKWMLGWTLIHAVVGSLSTTVYSHRLISHRAARYISWPVHVLFCFIGQVFAMQGSVRRWASLHVLHHGVDRTGQHHLDPYSATWFDSGWRNFLWSHMLTYCFHHPQNDQENRAFESYQNAVIVWQDRLYLPLLIALNFLLPMILGWFLAGFLGVFCMTVASIGGFILAQHNTWTVNSVTHMWGPVKAVASSARNNYLWLGPMGEGNHHADHHDYPRDYRNGFGWTGWLLDPSRYVILLLRALGLVRGLQRASKHQEAEFIAQRKLQRAQARGAIPLWESKVESLEFLKTEWLDATKRWEDFKAEKLQLMQAMGDAKDKFSPEWQERKAAMSAEVERARQAMRHHKEAFFFAVKHWRHIEFA